MSEYYTMKIAGLERNLEKFPVNEKLDIAAFIIFGDVELTIKGCEEFLNLMLFLLPKPRVYQWLTKWQDKAVNLI